MQLRRLRVKNIRSYVSADIDFGAGTTLIAGDVGSGKTSLLYAIEMALFGVAEVDAAYLVRHGAAHAEVSVAFEGPEQRYEIFRRFRRLRRKGRDTFEAERIRFTVNGAETSYSATELRQQVIGLLGFPDNPSPQAHSDLWRWAVYVPQERMRDILGARPQDRLETVRKALGVERYRTAAENAQELATDLRRSAASRRAEADRLRHFDEEFAEGNLQADRLRVDRATLDRALREREANVAALRVARTELESRTRKLEADERELAGLEREQQADHLSLEEVRRVVAERQEEARRRREESSSASADADALETRRGTLAGIDQELSRLRSELDRRSAGLRALAEGRAHVEAADRRVAEAREAVERNRTEEAEARRTNEEALAEGPGKEPPAPTPDTLPKIEERLSEAHGHEATALQAVAQAESSLAEIDELLRAGVCPRCRQPVRPSEYGTHRTEAAAELDATRATLAAVATDRQRWDEERRARERYERALDRWKEVEKRRIAARTVLGRATRSFEGSVRSLETAERSALAARQRVEELSPQESQDSALRAEFSRKEEARAGVVREVESSILAAERRRGIDRSLEVLQSETRRLEHDAALLTDRREQRAIRLSSLRTAREGIADLRRALVDAERDLRTAEDALNGERSTLVRLDAQLDEAVRRVAAAESGRRERAELLTEAKDVEEKAAWVGTSFRNAVLTMEQKLLTHAQALFERDFARYFASLIDDPGLVARTDPAFTPLVMIEGEWTPAEALSGGERTSLALAFRLALAQVVRAMGSLRLETMLLDEPTDGFSPEQVIRMGELLDELALPQVILVSHESELAAIADRVIRVEKVDGRSVLEGARPPAADESSLPADP
ncbi:MAG TPA: SMC family ATPase [Thermoplasmata archaeon]|nr:SMC family ATPase [Thermoplasmata archaeon]